MNTGTVKQRDSKKKLQAVVITGLSGSGKSTALNAFEDIGYLCIDNLPVSLLPQFFELKEASTEGLLKVALVMDAREPDFLTGYNDVFKSLKAKGFHLEILFLDARDEVLVQRFNQTRRRHPIKKDAPLLEAIREERMLLTGLKEASDRIIDTSEFNVHQLDREIKAIYGQRYDLDKMVIHLVSFGFKYGVPAEANLVFDVRFLPNPFFVPELKGLSGLNEEVSRFVLSSDEATKFLTLLQEFLSFLIPSYKGEGKSYLVIAIGCTGGHHRSVAVTEHIKRLFTREGEEVIVTHRDIKREEGAK